MKFIRTLLQSLTKSRQGPVQAAYGGYPFDGALDLYEFERRVTELARTRMVLYASGVGR
jgi:hypothetical protein